MAQALRFGDPRASGEGGAWSPAEYLWHMVDVVRIGAERLWTLALDPDAGVPAWDENDLARVRHYGDLSPRAAVAAYARAVADWVSAAAEAPAEATTVHSELGPIGAADVIRTNAHEAQHHLLDIEQAGRRPSANVFIARPHAGEGAESAPGVGTTHAGGAGRVFDDYVMVDWSANSTPRTGKDSIWIAAGAWRQGSLVVGDPANPATRHDAMALLDVMLGERLEAGRRVVVGFDFPFSYPAGLTAAFPDVFGPGPAWRALWQTLAERIRDTPDNTNNRWEVARALNAATGCRLFWGCPASEADTLLSPRDKEVPGLSERGEALGKFRLTERRAQGKGGAIQSVWKLAYAGSVGSQALLGIPHLEHMRSRYGERLKVWPFETAVRAGALHPPDTGDGSIVLAEIWPTIFPVDRSRHPVRDAAQVLEVVEACGRADAEATLAQWLAPAAFSNSDLIEQVAEEGWILGVT
jgi:hypothetical protein